MRGWSPQSAIGYMRGSMWALGIGAAAALMAGVVTRRSALLWVSLALELLILPVWIMKIELEKGLRESDD